VHVAHSDNKILNYILKQRYIYKVVLNNKTRFALESANSVVTSVVHGIVFFQPKQQKAIAVTGTR